MIAHLVAVVDGCELDPASSLCLDSRYRCLSQSDESWMNCVTRSRSSSCDVNVVA